MLNKELKQRSLFHLGTLVCLIALMFIATAGQLSWIYLAAISALGMVLLFEMKGILSRKGYDFNPVKMAFCQTFFLVACFVPWLYPQLFFACELLGYFALFCAVLFLLPAFFQEQEGAIARLAVPFFSFLYVTVPLGLIVKISYFFAFSLAKSYEGVFWLGLAIVVAKGGDVFAYLVGKGFGKRLLAPNISPKKTYEGAVASLVGSVVLGGVYAGIVKKYAFSFAQSSWLFILLLSFIMGIFALLGDLIESQMKRDADIKDSNVIPSVGGFLDILDSLVLTVLILYGGLMILVL